MDSISMHKELKERHDELEKIFQEPVTENLTTATQSGWILAGLESNNLLDIQTQQVQENLNDNLILNEQPVAVGNVVAPAQKKEQGPIRLSYMQRAIRKMGFGNEEELAEYEAYRRQNKEKNIKEKKEKQLHKGIQKIKDTFNALGKKQGNAYADKKKGILNLKNRFLQWTQRQGDIDDEKLNANEAGKKALTKYKSDTEGEGLDFGPMNMLLRSGNYSPDLKGINKTCLRVCREGEFENLDSQQIKERQAQCNETIKATKDAIEAIDQFSLDQDMALYRYSGLKTLGSMLGMKPGASAEEIELFLRKRSRKGLIIRDKAFLSTTMFMDTADTFKNKSAVHFHIIGRKGTKAYNLSRMRGLNDDGSKNDITNIQNKEQEMLLQAGTQLRVVKVEMKDVPPKDVKKLRSTKIFTVICETIPQVKENTNDNGIGA